MEAATVAADDAEDEDSNSADAANDVSLRPFNNIMV